MQDIWMVDSVLNSKIPDLLEVMGKARPTTWRGCLGPEDGGGNSWTRWAIKSVMP